MFFPMSCTSPFTVAMTMRPCGFEPSLFLRFHERGIGYATDFFITRALFTTCGKHFAGAEQIAHHAHAGHQRTFDDFERPFRFQARFFGIGIDEIDDPFDQRVLQSLFHRLAPPRFIRHDDFPRALYLLGKFDEALRLRQPGD